MQPTYDISIILETQNINPLYFSAYLQRPHPRQQEEFHLSMEGLFASREALQSSIHAGGSYEETHRREAAQVHGKSQILSQPISWNISEVEIDFKMSFLFQF